MNAQPLPHQQILEQRRATQAWQVVMDIKEHQSDKVKKEFAAAASGAPVDIQTNGLGQTMAFWYAKGYEKGSPKDHGNNASFILRDCVSIWVMTEMHATQPGDLLGWIRTASVDDYRRATAEAIAFLIWVKRFAEAEL
jgi:CRISPR-associated protein Cmr5